MFIVLTLNKQIIKVLAQLRKLIEKKKKIKRVTGKRELHTRVEKITLMTAKS